MIRSDSGRSIHWIKAIPLVLSFFLAVGGIFFFIWQSNYNAVMSALYLEIVCICLLRMNVYYVRNQLEEKASLRTLRIMKLLALIGGIIFSFNAIGDIVLALMKKQDFRWEYDGYYASAIPAFLGAFWSFILFFDCKKFESTYVQPVYLPNM
ncbi:uncharacterized protein [Parasteatoda tepidariorum]|uniref:uncharacterized protein n=1 Tax=Parasteatoda tepidariorum TaxID=114398 RepID=UPI00077FCE8E|nr:uncharacterized protein LOC107448285 [Parasteatoda tepidariorum]